MRPVKLGWTEGAVAVITQGVQAGERVVTDGQMTLKSGSLARDSPGPGVIASGAGATGRRLEPLQSLHQAAGGDPR